MKAITQWNYTPHMRYHEAKRATLPHICRVAPKLGGFLIEWFDKGAECPHKIIIKKRENFNLIAPENNLTKKYITTNTTIPKKKK